MANRKTLVIGGGIAGITTALELVRLGMSVEVVEKAASPGGYAAQFTCKAVDSCVKCGACIVGEKLAQAQEEPGINIRTGCVVEDVSRNGSFDVALVESDGKKVSVEADAIVLASGFKPYNPEKKQFGFNRFDNVITNLDLEKMLKSQACATRPSDGSEPEKIAFIQCVGSRDDSLKHLWCSKVCCGSSLRMARAIKGKQQGVECTVFYIDIQTFCKNFQDFYDNTKKEIRMVRAVPGDIFNVEDNRLSLSYFDQSEEKVVEELFDMVVLSIGITPGEGLSELSGKLDIHMAETGFAGAGGDGIFTVGTVRGPMSIADCMADAGSIAMDVVKYLETVS